MTNVAEDGDGLYDEGDYQPTIPPLVTRDTVIDELFEVIRMLHGNVAADAAAWRLVALHRALVEDQCLMERWKMENENGSHVACQ